MSATNAPGRGAPSIGTQPQMVRRAFVGFFGLNRSARWTGTSIRRNILRPLQEAGFLLTTAGHFNLPGTIDSVWSNERNVVVENDIRPLGLDFVETDPQEDEDVADLAPAVLSVPWLGRPDPDGRIRRNMLHQLHSLRRLDEMLERIGKGFDIYALLRPDLEYLDPLNVAELYPILAGHADILTPSWEEWGGLNDRFAFCNLRGAETFMRRAQHLQQFCGANGFILAERLLAQAVHSDGLRVVKTQMRAMRVRATGRVSLEGFPFSPAKRLWYRVRGRIRHGTKLARETILPRSDHFT